MAGLGWFLVNRLFLGFFRLHILSFFGVFCLFWRCFVVSGRVFDTNKHSNIKRRAEYRRINKYIKSPAQTKREKTRRIRVLDLWLKDWGIGRIASELGVTTRTVERDLVKLGETIKRRFERCARAASEEERLQLMRQLEGLSPVEQAKRINASVGKY